MAIHLPIELQVALLIINYVHYNIIKFIDNFYLLKKTKSISNSNIMVFALTKIALDNNADQKPDGNTSNNNNNSDNESVDPEVKELIKGREVLTFGPDAYCGNNNHNANAIHNHNSTNFTNISSTTSIIGTNGGVGGVGIGGGFNNLPHNQSPSPLTTHTVLTNSTSISATTPISLSMKNIKKFKNLSTNNSKSPNRLKEIQLQILELAQYCGDLDLGTSNRYGDVDSTSIIICSSSANTSSRSSYRSSLRSSFRNTSSSFSNGTDSPASFKKPNLQKDLTVASVPVNSIVALAIAPVAPVAQVAPVAPAPAPAPQVGEPLNLKDDQVKDDQESTTMQLPPPHQEQSQEDQLVDKYQEKRNELMIIETKPQRPIQALEVLEEDVEDEIQE
ncbi:unnamed protein product [Candida verbasci]|uniref:Uncharacterized protein n=1 Tax=Candida verbasci TaxID=1227364 RepID=A0A9W4XIW9_9ASCO|nr:unnamed protein product [Candida verbasci]